MTKAIIFDFDGVLADSEILYREIMMDEIQKLGIHYETDEYIAKFMGTREEYFYEEIAKDHINVHNTELAADFQPKLKNRLHREFAARLGIIEGIPELLSSLTTSKAVASSSMLKFLDDKMAWTGLGQYFGEHIYSGEQVENGKPAPDLFLFTADKLGVDPQDCIVIEDSENGVKAGVAAGMHVIGFCGGGHCDVPHGENLKQAGADKVAMDVEELAKILNL